MSSKSADETEDLLGRVIESLSGQHRENQVSMARYVADAIGNDETLLVQAGTGTGKSLGYLVPAVGALEQGAQRVVVATATLALQRQLVHRDIPAMMSALDATYSVAVLKGRANYVCLARTEEQGEDPEDALPMGDSKSALEEQAAALREWIHSSTTGDRDDYEEDIDPRGWRAVSATGRECVGPTKCRFGEQCFSEDARRSAAAAQVVVTNHALLALDGLDTTPIVPEHDVLIVDEGHEFPSRATNAATAEITTTGCERAFRSAGGLVSETAKDTMEDASALFDEALRTLGFDRQRFETVPEKLVAPLAAVRDAAHLAITELNSIDTDDAVKRRRALAGLEEIHETSGRLLTGADNDVPWYDAARTPGLHVAPLSVTEVTDNVVAQTKSVIMTSATLALNGTFEPFASALGLAPNAYQAVDVGSPFDYARQGILYVAADLPRPERGAMGAEILDRLTELVTAAGGGALVLLSSWRAVEEVHEHLAESLPDDVAVLVQKRGDPVGRLVDKFAEDSSSVLVGTMSLFQGVDVPGDACRLVVIDRIPFPRPDEPVLAARSDRVDAAGGSGFMQVSVPRASLLLAQGSGRLIRDPADQGLVAVLDSRLANSRYGSYILRSLPPFWRTQDVNTALAALSRLGQSADV